MRDNEDLKGVHGCMGRDDILGSVLDGMSGPRGGGRAGRSVRRMAARSPYRRVMPSGNVAVVRPGPFVILEEEDDGLPLFFGKRRKENL
jgi:hypothetical protein